jgi:hypothetical protein
VRHHHLNVSLTCIWVLEVYYLQTFHNGILLFCPAWWSLSLHLCISTKIALIVIQMLLNTAGYIIIHFCLSFFGWTAFSFRISKNFISFWSFIHSNKTSVVVNHCSTIGNVLYFSNCFKQLRSIKTFKMSVIMCINIFFKFIMFRIY